jgi:hypothetical protein
VAGAIPSSFVQTLTVINPTALTLEIDLVSEKDGRASITRTFGPIPAGGRGTDTIAVDTEGTLRVTARWTDAGQPQVGRTYTISYAKVAATPATLTFDSPFAGLGVWSSVVWDPPAAQP